MTNVRCVIFIMAILRNGRVALSNLSVTSPLGGCHDVITKKNTYCFSSAGSASATLPKAMTRESEATRSMRRIYIEDEDYSSSTNLASSRGFFGFGKEKKDRPLELL